MPVEIPEFLPGSGPAIVSARSRTPRILYLSPHWPHRVSGASELRALNVGVALQAFGDVEVVVVDGEGRAEEKGAREAHSLSVAYSLPVEDRTNRSLVRKVRWAFDPRVNYPHGCGVDRAATERVLRSARDFDMIWFCKLRTANMFPRWTWARSVLDIDDVPSTYEKSMVRTATSPVARIGPFLRFQSWRRRDRLLGERFTVLGVCSDADRRYLQGLGVRTPMHVIANGSPRPASPPVRTPMTPPRIGFMGIFDYEPNRAGVEWFVRECWPRIVKAVPGVRLRLVGRDTDGVLKPPGSDIDGLGFVSDVAAEAATWNAMIVPIRIGAGTRGKIAHAFSLKCPVVSTALGAYGYDAVDRDLMRLADSSSEFAAACIATIRDPAASDAMAERAWTAFLDRWTWDAIRPRIWAAAEDCLERSAEMSSASSPQIQPAPENNLAGG